MGVKAGRPDVSVIVPVYNVAAWLPACLDSLLNQSLQEWEAIVVDDGSSDESGAIADAYAARDGRFKVVHQKNTGLGGARNTGCKRAVGEYLFFLDSDDLLSRDTLQGMVDKAREHKADMVVGDFYTFMDGDETLNMKEMYPASVHFIETFKVYPPVFDWKAMQGNIGLLYFSTYFCVAWGKLFRRALWDKMGCESPGNLRMAEDFIAVKKFMFAAKRIAVYPQAGLLYRKRAGSATTTRTRKTFEVFRAYGYALQMFKDVGVYEGQFNLIYRFFLETLMNHMLWFTPYKDWYRFYWRAQAIISTWDSSRMEHDLRMEVNRYQRAPWRAFAETCGRYFRSRLITLKGRLLNGKE